MSFTIRVLGMAADQSDFDWLVALSDSLENYHISVDLTRDTDLKKVKGYHVLLLDASLGIEQILSILTDGLFLDPGIPVLVSVLESDLTAFEHTIRYGAQDFILKDFDTPASIRRCVVNALDRYSILRATEESESQIRSLVEGLSDGILVLDKTGVVLYANESIEYLLGRSITQLYGMKTPFELPEHEQKYITWERPNSPPVTLSVQLSQVRWDGLDSRMLILRDVTAEQASYELLRSARKSAEKVGAMKAAFLANMSHELRMPLASIIGFAQLIEEGETNPDFKEFATLIQESGNRLLDTINSVLEATRLDQHSLDSHPVNLDLAASVHSTVKRLQPLVAQPDVVLTAEGPSGITILADPAFLERILNNLIGNAAKFTSKGHIRVSWEVAEDQAIIRVNDSGVGISPEFLNDAFLAFTQESSGSTRQFGGTGLGLSISKQLVELMGGTISVTSEKGSGSTFTFTLPLAPKTQQIL